MLSSLLHPLVFLLTFATASGILVHDTHIDKATTALAMPAIVTTYDINNKSIQFTPDFHTHVERGATAQILHTFSAHQPRIAPRITEDKKHLLQKHVTRRHHAFDNYNLPLVP